MKKINECKECLKLMEGIDQILEFLCEKYPGVYKEWEKTVPDITDFN